MSILLHSDIESKYSINFFTFFSDNVQKRREPAQKKEGREAFLVIR